MRPSAKRVAAIAASAAWLASLGVTIAGQPVKTTKDGVYTAEQAARGRTVYDEKCSGCHGDDLSGGGFAPALAADIFFAMWTDKTLGRLFGSIKDTMPAGKPGSLSAESNADIVAYMLAVNGLPAGQQPLPADAAVLQQIVIAKP